MLAPRLLMAVATLISPLFLNLMGGLGLIFRAAENYGDGLLTEAHRNYLCILGGLMLLSSAFMSVGAVLCLFGKNRAAIAVSTVGFLACMAVMVLIMRFADGITDNAFKLLSNKYLLRHLPTAVPFALILLISIKQQSLSVRQSIKKADMPADKIIDD